MAEQPEQERLDVAEFAATLLAEVRSGIAASRSEAAQGALEVVEAVVRVGEPASPQPDPEEEPLEVPDTDSGGGGDGDAEVERREPTGSPIVVRSGPARSGWQIELVLRGEALHDRPRSQHGGSGGEEDDAQAAAPTAFALWRDRPLADLKGIDRVRTGRLGQLGIATIGELLALDEDEIAKVATVLRSRRYVDLWVQVALLQTAAPVLGPSRADALQLAALAGRSPGQLRATIGSQVCSRSASVQLFDLLAAFGAALDQAAMRSVTLRELRAATRRRS